MADTALRELGPRFARLYASPGRPSIAPEKLLRTLLLQILYTVRSERQLIEQLDYNLLFRWFVGLSMDDPVWDVTVFTKNRERLLAGEVAQAFFNAVLDQARSHDLLSAEHFTVDGTLVEAWASLKSFKRKGEDSQTPPDDDPGNPSVDFHGERRANATHQSTTDPEARLYKKRPGSAAKLCYMGHVEMENRNGLAVNSRLTQAHGRAEPSAALEMVEEIPGLRRVTLGADKGYDRKEFVRELRDHNVTRISRRSNRAQLTGAPAPGRLRHQPDQAQAGRGDLRLAQDRGRAAQGSPSESAKGGLDVYLGAGRLQPGADAQPAARASIN